MRQYVNFGIECTTDEQQANREYEEFKRKYKFYLVDAAMELYKIPYNTPEYAEIKKLQETYGWDWESGKCRDYYLGFYIDEGLLITEYSSKDFEDAEAYLINFHTLVYPYESIDDYDFVGECCESPKWKL